MGETGPQIAILVFYVVPHLNSMVSSTIPAWDASVNDFGVVEDDRREPPGIEGHRPGPLGILSDQDSLLATTARCQWFRTAGSPSNQPHSVHGPSKSRAAASGTSRSPLGSKLLESRSGLPTKGSWSRFCRTRRPGRVFCRGTRIRRAGCSRDRRLAGDSGIDHQLLGSGRRRFTIHKVWPAAEKGYPREGPVDLGCS